MADMKLDDLKRINTLTLEGDLPLLPFSMDAEGVIVPPSHISVISFDSGVTKTFKYSGASDRDHTPLVRGVKS